MSLPPYRLLIVSLTKHERANLVSESSERAESVIERRTEGGRERSCGGQQRRAVRLLHFAVAITLTDQPRSCMHHSDPQTSLLKPCSLGLASNPLVHQRSLARPSTEVSCPLPVRLRCRPFWLQCHAEARHHGVNNQSPLNCSLAPLLVCASLAAALSHPQAPTRPAEGSLIQPPDWLLLAQPCTSAQQPMTTTRRPLPRKSVQERRAGWGVGGEGAGRLAGRSDRREPPSLQCVCSRRAVPFTCCWQSVCALAPT